MDLAGRDILEIWTRAHDLDSRERVLRVLAILEHASVADVARLPIGERDRRLLELWRTHCGPTLSGCTQCPACGERLEFEVEVERLGLAAAGGREPHETFLGENGALTCVYRLPTTEDERAAAQASSRSEACALLVERCVTSASREGEEITAADLVPEDLAWLSAEMLRCAPLSDAAIELLCSACGHAWSSRLDPGRFLWSAIERQAVALLDDVHVLAAAYGWTEAEILALPGVRRRAYRERLSS